MLHSLAMVKLFAEYKSILSTTLRQLRNPFMTTAVQLIQVLFRTTTITINDLVLLSENHIIINL